jgi:hypothetical protein
LLVQQRFYRFQELNKLRHSLKDIDNMQISFGRMKMSHMIADSLEELHAMAKAIGVNKKWFQPTNHPHYDICKAKRQLALQNGAIAVSERELVKMMRKKNEA